MQEINTSIRLGFDALLKISSDGTILSSMVGHKNIFGQDPVPLCVPGGFESYFEHAPDLLFTFNLFRVDRNFQQSSFIYVNISQDGLRDNWVSIRLTRTEGHSEVWAFINDANDIIAQLNQAKFEATHDLLTGMPNRAALFSELTRLCKDKAEGVPFGLVALDLDGFKQINDAFGHLTGDKFLQEIAHRLRRELSPDVSAYRLGGDEFAFLVKSNNLESDVLQFANRILLDCAMPGSLPGIFTSTSGSIGVSLFPEHATAAEALLGAADIAMYQAKNQGKNRVVFYKPEASRAAKKHVELAANMQSAVNEGEFCLHYQPIFTPNRELVGCEALMRWTKPDGTSISPLDFIPVAEQTGLIKLLGTWALKSASQQMKQWSSAGHQSGNPYVSVNVSSHQFSAPNFIAQVNNALKLSELPPSQLQLEITESALLADPERTAGLLRTLRDLGIRLAIDDFGTGYSSLAYLRNFPVNVLKIDRSFIKNILDDKANRAIVTAVISLAGELDMEVVAEGVETQEQLEYLKSKGVSSIQGWLFGKAQPVKEFHSNYFQA